MGLNHTLIAIWTDDDFWERKTLKSARRIVVNHPGARMQVMRWTPSGSVRFGRWMRRMHLEFRRREADAKKRMERLKLRGGAIDWLERERINRDMSQWQFERYAAGVRKGTIL